MAASQFHVQARYCQTWDVSRYFITPARRRPCLAKSDSVCGRLKLKKIHMIGISTVSKNIDIKLRELVAVAVCISSMNIAQCIYLKVLLLLSGTCSPCDDGKLGIEPVFVGASALALARELLLFAAKGMLLGGAHVGIDQKYTLTSNYWHPKAPQ